MTVDLIRQSGRESMSLAERIGLLIYDRSWLEQQPGSGVSAHDRANLLLTIVALEYCYEHQATMAKLMDRELPLTECLILAWRRGGHEEFKIVRSSQRSEQ